MDKDPRQNDGEFVHVYPGYAKDWLAERLASGGVPSKRILDEARAAAIPRSTLSRTAKKLKVVKSRSERGEDVIWSLPDHLTPSDHPASASKSLILSEGVCNDAPVDSDVPPSTRKTERVAHHGPAPLAPFKAVIGGEEVDAVNARDLHAWVRSGHEFANWFKLRCQQGMLLEDQDFGFFEGSLKKSGRGRPAIDYAVTVDAAMHMAMLEQTEFGRSVRQDLIDWKKRAKALERAAAFNPAQLSRIEILQMALASEQRAIDLEKQVSHQSLMIEQRTAEAEAERVKNSEILDHMDKLSTEVVGYRRFMESDREILISQAARNLDVPQAFLFDFLQGPTPKNKNQGVRWIFRRGPGKYSPYREVRGTYVVLKEGVLKDRTHSDGSPIYTEQCRITPLGMIYLSKLFNVLKIGKNGMPSGDDGLFDGMH